MRGAAIPQDAGSQRKRNDQWFAHLSTCDPLLAPPGQNVSGRHLTRETGVGGGGSLQTLGPTIITGQRSGEGVKDHRHITSTALT